MHFRAEIILELMDCGTIDVIISFCPIFLSKGHQHLVLNSLNWSWTVQLFCLLFLRPERFSEYFLLVRLLVFLDNYVLNFTNILSSLFFFCNFFFVSACKCMCMCAHVRTRVCVMSSGISEQYWLEFLMFLSKLFPPDQVFWELISTVLCSKPVIFFKVRCKVCPFLSSNA